MSIEEESVSVIWRKDLGMTPPSGRYLKDYEKRNFPSIGSGTIENPKVREQRQTIPEGQH